MKRISVAPPPRDLIEQMKKQKVVPFVGAGLSKAVLISGASTTNLPDYRQLLEAILDRANLTPSTREIIRKLLDTGDSRSIEKAARDLREEMGPYQFYRIIRAILEPIDAQTHESMAHKLLRMLNFKRIVTTNYDRFLERYVAPDYEVFTARDIEAFRLFLAEPERSFILKLHGDITRPDTIPFGLTDLYQHYGYRPDGTKTDIISPATKLLTEFMENLFRNNTVLFLGSSLAESEGYACLLRNLVTEWGGSLPYTHYALVPHDPSGSDLRRHLSREMNLHFIEYTPDDVHSQVWEFIAFLNAGVFDDQPRVHRKWGQSYLPDRREDYLKRQLEREQTANQICFITPALTNAITTQEDLFRSCRKGLELRFNDADFIERVLQIMELRRKNIEDRLNAGDLEIRVLFLETKLREAFQAKGVQLEGIVKRYEYLLKLIEKPNLEVRLIPYLTENMLRDNYSASHAIIYNRTNILGDPEADVAIAYASQATSNLFEIHIIQINTTEVKERVYQFEQFWAAALSEKQTVKYIQELIVEAKKDDE